MGKKSKKKRKNEPIEYEGYQYGPFKIERFGRLSLVSTDWNLSDHKKFIEDVKLNRPKHKESINDKIKELIDLFKSTNPFDLLMFLSSKNCIHTPEIEKETTSEKKEIYVEYALSIVTALCEFNFEKRATEDDLKRCSKHVANIINEVIWYFASEAVEMDSDPVSFKTKFESISRYLIVRGDSYPEHHIELIRGLFHDHNRFLADNFGFSIEDVLAMLNYIEKQILENIRLIQKNLQMGKELHGEYKNLYNKGEFDNCASIEDIREKLYNSDKVQQIIKEVEKDYEKYVYIPFEISPNEVISKKLLDLFSLNLGDNKDFLKFEKFSGWPTNNSIIYEKPIIKHDEKYYCFIPQVLFRNLKNILECWIQDKDSSYFEDPYQKKRAKFLENKGIEYLGQLLPYSKIYQSLYYEIEVNGETKRVESDGLILYDNNLFILEAKAGTFSLKSKRGAELSLKNELEGLMDKAYSQALRTKNYISYNDEPKFTDESGREILVLNDKKKYKNIFLINITLENLGQWSANLNSAKRLNLLQGHEWPWSIFINDLRIISEIIEYPSAFLLYLKRRLRANDFPQFKPYDETDFLMYFFNDGLYFEAEQLPPHGSVSLAGYTEDLDRYYDFIAGRVSNGEKPKIKANSELQKIVQEIEYKCNHKANFTEISTALLGFSAKSQEDYISYLNKAIDFAKQDDKNHDVTLVTSDFGFTTFITKNFSQYLFERAEDYCYRNMYETKKEIWYCLFIDINDFQNKSFDFKIYEKKWEYDQELDSKVEVQKKKRAERIKSTFTKIGRNDPCPCGSGKKYKKCCGK